MKSDLTIKALVIGIILSIVMTAANMYLGLKVGMTISANIPCSVIAIILVGIMLHSRSVAEVNLAQSTGSVGEGLAAGVVFIFPALVLSGAFKPFAEWGMKEYAVITFAVMAGSILGVMLTGFLRRPMVRDCKELRYPEGIATAEILKTGMSALNEGKAEGVIPLLFAFIGGAFVKIASLGVAILQETVSATQQIGNAIFKVGVDVSAALVGVGFILEFNGAMLVAMGGAIAWLIFVPLFTANPSIIGIAIPANIEAADFAEMVWRNHVRFLGVGAMIVGGVWSIINIRKQLVAAIKEVIRGIKGAKEHEEADVHEVDLSQKTIWGLIFVGLLMSASVYFSTVDIAGATIATIYTIVAIFFFVAISVYIVGLIGSTNQPVSGITICTFLLAAVFLYIGGIKDMNAVTTLLMIAGVVCLAACLSGTTAQNFRTSMIVGTSPKAIQIGLLLAVVFSSFLAAPVMVFIDKAYGIGKGLKAPQADMFASMAQGLFKEGASIPWNMVGYGMLLGVILVIIGLLLKHFKCSFGISPMAVAVGIYLPFSTTLPILLGGIVHLIVTKRIKVQSVLDAAIQKGTVLCAGLVAGEAITAILIAILMLDWPMPFPCIDNESIRTTLSVIVLISLLLSIYFGTGKKDDK
ncbi:MAG: oligopeptide transporter, OPT family [Planctomycetes bacterium]|jgi:putative OPT family oligopeptide transporter|nr:oligopeptide transporter, OPT family [Planctomycetota bacterium]HPY74999.1 oligopeptide transporter, OPT family [Planctomycetota bacterium]HQB01311.1 oligopeptide transporter, OPT family [Planctomycetota bacterium]